MNCQGRMKTLVFNCGVMEGKKGGEREEKEACYVSISRHAFCPLLFLFEQVKRRDKLQRSKVVHTVLVVIQWLSICSILQLYDFVASPNQYRE